MMKMPQRVTWFGGNGGGGLGLDLMILMVLSNLNDSMIKKKNQFHKKILLYDTGKVPRAKV